MPMSESEDNPRAISDHSAGNTNPGAIKSTEGRSEFYFGGVAIVSGLLLGFYQLLNTGIGWHLASGRWMLEHHEILRSNLFTFGAPGRAWLNHEWFFQILAALADRLGGPAGLVLLRMLAVGILSLLLYRQSRRAELAPGASLLLAFCCLFAARWRFFVRPELITLILLPLGLDLFFRRSEAGKGRRALGLAAVMVIGVNSHAGILLLPLLAGIAVVGDQLSALLGRKFDPRSMSRDLGLLGLVGFSSLINPWGVKTIMAPFYLAGLISRPWAKNPEWSFPTWARFPELYLVIPAGFLLLLFFDRSWSRRLVFLVISILGMRYVRNEGLFFVLVPLLLGPALAQLGIPGRLDTAARRRLTALSAVAVLVLSLLSLGAKGFPAGMGYAPDRYPIRASKFLKEEGLLEFPLYNDVRFGGWLIGAFYPPTRVFIDDRNEVHEDLLRKIWEIQSSSSPRKWQNFLDSYHIRSAILKYKKPVPVEDPRGNFLGYRGWSALWFPAKRWALVYWDDQAMVLVDRKTADPDWLSRAEYSMLRPDDGEYLRKRIEEEPSLREEIAGELARHFREDPESRRASDLVELLLP